ncbi:MAG: putative peptidase [Saprospiraceae bacterium]|jgi:predicted peptidase
MTIKKALLFCFLIVFFSNGIFAQEKNEETGKYLFKTYEKENKKLNYRILFPPGFDQNQSYPLVVFLHGAGERGADNKAQLIHGSQLFLDSIEKYPAIIIFPQCPKADYWANLSRPDRGGRERIFTFHKGQEAKPTLTLVMNLMDEMIEKNYIDQDRIYITGLSMGGMGVWELLWRMPEKIAAALPICGGGLREKAKEMINIPIWVFHGVQDDVVHPRYSVTMTKAVQAAGGKAKISLYPNAKHNSWDLAFKEPKFLSWMFSKRRKKS